MEEQFITVGHVETCRELAIRWLRGFRSGPEKRQACNDTEPLSRSSTALPWRRSNGIAGAEGDSDSMRHRAAPNAGPREWEPIGGFCCYD